jgi:TetR/AcrR family transcriptional regulator, transcriptional repressor of aconitase
VTTRRLTREEQRARTRADLLDAAAVTFARNGYHATSVDMVAEAAGYTKGAVYSNFDSKEELFLTLLDAHLDQAVDTVTELIEQTPASDRAAALADRREKIEVLGRDWFLLETEFILYAARNEAAAERIAASQRRTRRRLADLVERHLTDLGATTDVASEDLALLLSAAGDGLTIARLTQPEVDADRLLGLLLSLLERAASR